MKNRRLSSLEKWKSSFEIFLTWPRADEILILHGTFLISGSFYVRVTRSWFLAYISSEMPHSWKIYFTQNISLSNFRTASRNQSCLCWGKFTYFMAYLRMQHEQQCVLLIIWFHILKNILIVTIEPWNVGLDSNIGNGRFGGRKS